MIRTALTFTIALALPTVGLGAILEVDWAGSADYTTIQAALVHAAEGDTVLVHPGEYSAYDAVHGRIVLWVPLTLRSTAGADVTTINGHSHHAQCVISYGNLVLEGFTINGGEASIGLVTNDGANARVSNCVIRNCSDWGAILESGTGNSVPPSWQ